MFSTTRAAAIAIVLGAFTKSIAAQATPAAGAGKARLTIGSTQTTAGYVKFAFADLDTRMAAAGLPATTQAAATIGFGADVRVARILVGAGYQSLIAGNRLSTQYRTRTSGSFSLFDIGYAAIRSRGLSVYPVLGAGATQLSVNVKERGDFSFDEGLQSPAREIRLSGAAALMHTGLMVEQKLERRGSEYAIGVRLGAIRSIGRHSWASADSRVSDGPSGISGSYVRVVLSRSLRRRRDAVLPFAATAVQAVVR